MSLNEDLRAAAKNLLQSLGGDGTLVVETTAFDKEEGRAYVTDVQSHSVKMSPPSPYVQFFNGVAVITEDLLTIVAADGLAVVPVQRNKLIFASKTHTIVAVEPLYGGNLPVAYQLRMTS